MNTSSSAIWNLLSFALLVSIIAFVIHSTAGAPGETASVASVATTTTPGEAASTKTTATATPKIAPIVAAVPKKQTHTEPTNATISTVTAQPSSDQVTRINDPYSFAPLSSDQVNTDARSALVNILCLSNGSLHPISGSGMFIDPRGVILTNAHVAQYILLSENPGVDLSCYIRTGSPAQAKWTATLLYMPPMWVAAHAADINEDHPTGTGEHDYALLMVSGSTDGSPLPSTFPYMQFDTRERIGFTGDQSLVASYPAEFVGGLQTENNLFAATSITTIGQLMTFQTNSVDVISLGGIIEAQSGSSGGGVINPWDRLIGIITTTSEGTTTASRNLRAITLSYINRDIAAQSGKNLSDILGGNLLAEQQDFNTRVLPDLMAQYLKVLQ